MLQTFSAMSSSESETCSTTETPTELVSCSSTSSLLAPVQGPRVPTPKELLRPKAEVRRPPENYTSAARVRTHYKFPSLDRKYPLDRKLLPGGPVLQKAGKPGALHTFLIPVVAKQPSIAPSSAPKPAPPPKSPARLDAREGVLVRAKSASARPIPPAVGDSGKGKGKGKGKE